jgi:hypothetical protein
LARPHRSESRTSYHPHLERVSDIPHPYLRFWVFPEMRQGQHNDFSTICGDVCVSVRVSPECVRKPPILPLWGENSPDVDWERSEGKPSRRVEELRSGQGSFLFSVNSQSCQRGVRNVGV